MFFGKLRLFLLCTLLGVSVLVSASVNIFEDDFKDYPDYDPAIKNWAFHNIGGEVIGGKFMFNMFIGSTKGLVRDFSAGPSVKINAAIKVCSHECEAFNKESQAGNIQIVICSRMLECKKEPEKDIPLLALSLDCSDKGKRNFSFNYSGKTQIAVTAKVITDILEWKSNVLYDLEIILDKDTAVGTVRENNRIIYQKELKSSDFKTVFAQAFPGFSDYKMTGELTYFKADNLNSVSEKNNKRVLPLPLPKFWKASIDDRDISFNSGEPVDFGKLFGGHGAGKQVVLTTIVDSPETCFYAINCQADWFWKLDVNGKTAVDYLEQGCPGADVLLPLDAGKNTLSLTLKSGAAGWKFCFSKTDADKAKTLLAQKNIWGSDTLFWNCDRILDDIANLKRRGIALSDLEKEIVELRKVLPADLDSKEIVKYDPLLDRAFGLVYNAYRYIELMDTISEFKDLNADETKISRLEQLATELIQQILSGTNVEKTATEAQNIINDCRKSLNGFAEGVTKGGSFGRFGWITSDKLGRYSSGDGLLANQVLSNGAIARQYIASANNPKENYVTSFRFEGRKDDAVAEKLSTLPTIGRNVEIQFGYDPSQFYSGATPANVKVKEINWIHKKFAVADAFMIDMNLVAPALLVESPYKEFVLSDSPTGAFTNIGYKNAEGKIISAPIGKNGVIYDSKTDGLLGSNWIVLWNGNNTEKDLTGHIGNIPLQIIFQHQPETIERTGNQLRIAFAKGGALWLNTLYGARLQPTGNWRGELPPKAVAKADFFGRSALAYPTNCREFYRYDAEKNQVEILNKYSFRYFNDNDWNIIPLEIALLPPVLSLMTDYNFDAELPSGLRDLDYPTIYGPLRGVAGNQISYILPVPDVPNINIARNTEADPKTVADLERYAFIRVHGVRSFLFEERMSYAWVPRVGALERSKQWQYLPPSYQKYLKGLYSYNMKAFAGYRTNRFWRSLIEPYSGKKYFYSFSISAKGPGDVGVFGDRGFGIGLHLLELDKAAAYSGNYDLLRQIWSDNVPLASPDAIKDGKYLTVDKMFGYLKNVHDWAWMEDGSNDCGDNGPVVDCSQTPFAGNSAFFRMAKEIGTPADISKAAYHLGKGQLSLIGRLPFTGYGHENGLLGVDNINVGFRECITPECYANSPMHTKNKRQEYDSTYTSLLAYAAGDDGFDIYFPYAKYIWNDLRKYEKIRRLYFPNTDTDKTGNELYAYIMFLILDGQPLNEVQAIFNNMTVRYNGIIGTVPLLISSGAPLVLAAWYPLELPDFKFTPSAQKAEVKFKTVPQDYKLHALSSLKPVSVKTDGKELMWSYDPKTFKLVIDVPAGENIGVEVLYDKIDPQRFTPIPHPPELKTIPEFQEKVDNAKFERAEPKNRAVKNLANTSGKTVSADKVLFNSDFTAEPVADMKSSGGFGFMDWGKSQAQPSGGITGSYPNNGKPALSLEVKATADNFTGRISPGIKLPESISELVITGKVMRSDGYKGNNPMIFAWIVAKDKKGKPIFYDIPHFENSKWQDFTFTLPASKLPENYETMQINLASRRDKNAHEFAGSIFYKEIKVVVK